MGLGRPLASEYSLTRPGQRSGFCILSGQIAARSSPAIIGPNIESVMALAARGNLPPLPATIANCLGATHLNWCRWMVARAS